MKRICIFTCFFILFVLFCSAQQGTPIPLPYLNILPPQRPLQAISPETVKIINNLLKNAPSPEITSPHPYIFLEDRDMGSDYLLSSILENYFIPQKWQECEAELEKYLIVNRPLELTARAGFYLAQTLYFEGKYSQSLYKFLETMDYFPAHTQLWIQSVLLKLSDLNPEYIKNQR